MPNIRTRLLHGSVARRGKRQCVEHGTSAQCRVPSSIGHDSWERVDVIAHIDIRPRQSLTIHAIQLHLRSGESHDHIDLVLHNTVGSVGSLIKIVCAAAGTLERKRNEIGSSDRDEPRPCSLARAERIGTIDILDECRVSMSIHSFMIIHCTLVRVRRVGQLGSVTGKSTTGTPLSLSRLRPRLRLSSFSVSYSSRLYPLHTPST